MFRRSIWRRIPTLRTAKPGSGDEGVAALEFALIAPLFLVLIFGIIVYAIYFATWIAVTEAASEGARAAVAGLSTGERASLATAQANAVLDAYGPLIAPGNVTVTPQQVPGDSSSYEVSVTYNFASLGLSKLAGLLPIPTATPTATVIVANGG